MSEHDEALLDEDFGDDEYDLGNDEEEALLADDNDFERLPVQQTISKAEEETDDVLDLGVTDALDDLETEEENAHFENIHDISKCNETYANKKVNIKLAEENERVISQKSQECTVSESSDDKIGKQKDLREKLREKSNNYRESFIGGNSSQPTEDDNKKEIKEKRNRFPTERVVIMTKMNQDIPDSLENVLTAEQHKSSYRGRDKGDRGDKNNKVEKNDKGDRNDRIDRKSSRGRSGGRYDLHQSGRYYHSRGPLLSNQQPSFRGLTVDHRASFVPLGLINNIPLSQHHQSYPYHKSQGQAPYHQPISNSPIPGHPHFIDPNLTSPFAESIIPPQGSRINGPRIDYGSLSTQVAPIGAHLPGPQTIINHPPGPSSSLGHHPSGPSGSVGPPGTGPVSNSFNCSSNQPQFSPGNQTIFSNHGMPRHISEGRGSIHPNNQGAPLCMMPGSGSAGIHVSGNQVPMISVTQTMPVQSFIRPQVSNFSASRPNILNSTSSQPTFENRLSFSETPQFKSQLTFDSRNSYINPSINQINNVLPKISLPLAQNTSQQVHISNVPNVTSIPNVPVVPSGHKILINPHFRGNPAKNDVGHDPTDKFVQALRNASNSTLLESRHSTQQIKSDDPYSYFSDVWQENKSQRLHSNNSRRSYSPENSYSKCNSNNRYKSESQRSHKDGHSEKLEYRNPRDAYRDKESSPKLRVDQRHHISSPNSNCQNEDDPDIKKITSQKDTNTNSTSKELCRAVIKRSKCDISDDTNKVGKKKSKLNEKLFEKLQKELEEKINKVDEDEETDPEMKEYRRKMEEQKRLREKILREKENRRKLAAMQKRNLPSDDLDKIVNIKQETTNAVCEDESSKIEKNFVIAKRPCKSIILKSSEEKPLRVVRAVLRKNHKEHLTSMSNTDAEEEIFDHVSSDEDDKGKNDLLSRKVHKAKGSQKCLQKCSTQNVQKISVAQTVNANRQLGQIRQLLTHSQRIVVPNISKQQCTTSHDSQQKQIKRIVMSKPISSEPKKVMKSNVVKIDNLAASTTEMQIRRMCHGIGSIESIQMGDSNATIVFKTHSAAMVFHKKYQRKMLDLSLIKVQLVPQAISNKSVIFLKNSSKE